jgi:hypothetical protein
VYLLTNAEFGAYKIGIAGAATKRRTILARRGWETYKTYAFEHGRNARQVENAILRWWRTDLGLQPHLAAGDGWTETLDADALSLVDIWDRVTLEASKLEPSQTT